MKKRITEYRKRVDRLLADEEEKTYEEWECILVRCVRQEEIYEGLREWQAE